MEAQQTLYVSVLKIGLNPTWLHGDIGTILAKDVISQKRFKYEL